ncbi:MAG TPA: TolC family protein [Saprospiraceae bacterium]|nr:TolC family protein [Saprospiraceae bacterium]
MRPYPLALFLLALWPLAAHAGDTLTVQQCRDLALQNSPLQQRKLYAEAISALQINSLHSNSLPRINVGAQATWQSDVFGLPFRLPGSDIPSIPKDQYRVSVDVAQRVWDGGSDRYLRQQRELERDLAAAQTDVEVFTLRETVTDLYFKILLLRESASILQSSKKDLETRLAQAEAAVKEGISLRTHADQIKIQILKTEQQIVGVVADRAGLMRVLGQWVGRPAADFDLKEPALQCSITSTGDQRPEYRLFELQQKSWQLQKDRLALQRQPRIEAFAQGGLGRPNPFNLFETGFQPFAMLGLRAAWTPVDWGNRKRDAQVYELQMKNVEAQRSAFAQRLSVSTQKEQWDLREKYSTQLAQDAAIISLQEDIVRRADAQVKNGVMTTADYLAQLNLLTQARLSQKTHALQWAQTQALLEAKLEN